MYYFTFININRIEIKCSINNLSRFLIAQNGRLGVNTIKEVPLYTLLNPTSPLMGGKDVKRCTRQ